MNFLSLFSGVGGFDLGLERAGMKAVGQVEIDPFCNLVLKKHWPDVKRTGDIKNVKGTEFGTVELVCGGFPCQPFSSAGKRKGKKDDRYLWPEMLRVISAARPTWIIGENVGGLVNMAQRQDDSEMDIETNNEESSDDSFGANGILWGIIEDLNKIGYDVQCFIIPACAVNAPHRRDRLWILGRRSNVNDSQSRGRGFLHSENVGTVGTEINAPADTNCNVSNSDGNGRDGTKIGKGNTERSDNNQKRADQLCEPERANSIREDVTHSKSPRLQRGKSTRSRSARGRSSKHIISDKRYIENESFKQNWVEVATRLCRVDDGLPRRMDRAKRLKALGNAVVPQIVEIIGRAIIETEKYYE